MYLWLYFVLITTSLPLILEARFHAKRSRYEGITAEQRSVLGGSLRELTDGSVLDDLSFIGKRIGVAWAFQKLFARISSGFRKGEKVPSSTVGGRGAAGDLVAFAVVGIVLFLVFVVVWPLFGLVIVLFGLVMVVLSFVWDLVSGIFGLFIWLFFDSNEANDVALNFQTFLLGLVESYL